MAVNKVQNAPPQPKPEVAPALAPSTWSWGAFWLDAFFLIAIKRYTLLFWYLLAFVPLLNVLFFIIFKLYLGARGRQLAEQSPVFASREERNGFFKGIDHAGKIIFFAFLIIFVLSFLIAILGVVFLRES